MRRRSRTDRPVGSQPEVLEIHGLSRPHSTEVHRRLLQDQAVCRAVDSADQAMAFLTGLSAVKRWPGVESRSSPVHFARPCTDSRSPSCTARRQFPSRSWGRATASSLDRFVEVSIPEWPRVLDLETVGPKSPMRQRIRKRAARFSEVAGRSASSVRLPRQTVRPRGAACACPCRFGRRQVLAVRSDATSRQVL